MNEKCVYECKDGIIPPISQERLTALLMEYPDASREGIDKLLAPHPCPKHSEVKS
jgi:hypothetical protein